MKKLTKEDIVKIISKNQTHLENEFGVKNLYLFGSYARDEQRKDSDIDFIVDFKFKKSPMIIFSLGVYLKNLFNKEIDIGERNEIKDDYKPYILNEYLLKC